MALDWSTLNIVFEGDSLTARNAANGSAATPQAGNVADALETLQPTATYSNVAADGHRTDEIEATGASTVDTLIDGGKTNVLVTLIGTNDGLQAVAAATAFGNWQDYWTARAAGWDLMICLTAPDAVGISAFLSSYNTSIRGGYAALGLVLIDMAVEPEFDDDTDRTYIHTDGIHFKQPAIDAFAALVEGAIEAELGGPTLTVTTANFGTLTIG